MNLLRISLCHLQCVPGMTCGAEEGFAGIKRSLRLFAASRYWLSSRETHNQDDQMLSPTAVNYSPIAENRGGNQQIKAHFASLRYCRSFSLPQGWRCRASVL